MSDGLLQFLRDQCNADHAIALLACATGGEPDVLSDGETPTPWRADHAKVFVAGRHAVAEATSSNRAMHIARHDPARVLREIDAKRQTLEALIGEGHTALRPGGSTDIYCGADYGTGEPCDCGRDERVNQYVRLLALPYADRPGYREEWRP